MVLLFVALRAPLVNVPMERDEGEYATIGLGMIHGIPPYLDSYTMKLPGAASMHALIYLVLGPSARSIHMALLFLNAVTIILIAFVARRFCKEEGALFAAMAYGTFTIGLGVFGPWLSAEHFATFFLMLGALLIPATYPTGNDDDALSKRLHTKWMGRFVLGAMTLGFAFIIKQHALLPAMGWLAAAVWILIVRNPAQGVRSRVGHLAIVGMAFAFPLIATIAAMRACGVFESFSFWTWTYARQYISGVPLRTGWEYFKIGAGQVFYDEPMLWIMAGAGFWILVRRGSKDVSSLDPGVSALQLLPATLGGLAAASAGLMFRGQYFILLVPYAAVLCGVSWWTFRSLPSSKKPMSIALAGTILLSSFLVLYEPLMLGMRRTPKEICRLVYGMNPFPEYPVIAQFVREHSKPEEKVVVIGSEPAIYFLANRRPASPYLCVYEMVKPHAFARTMQEEAIRRIATAAPPCMVVVDIPTSWGIQKAAEVPFLKWLDVYTRNHYVLEGILDLISEEKTEVRWGEDARRYQPESLYTISLYTRKE